MILSSAPAATRKSQNYCLAIVRFQGGPGTVAAIRQIHPLSGQGSDGFARFGDLFAVSLICARISRMPFPVPFAAIGLILLIAFL